MKKGITTVQGVIVLKEFLTKKIGREVSYEEAFAAMEALEKAYNNGELDIPAADE